MLDMEQIQSYFPEHLHQFRRNMVREYLQYKILEAAFSSTHGRHLSFLGGTAIHIIHGNPRFSEDLDFDNRGLPMGAFEEMATDIQRTVRREGYEADLVMNRRGNFRANLRFIGLLQRLGISGHREEKLLIHLDAEPQRFDYRPVPFLLNKFDVFSRINTVPIDILLSQKIGCILQRPRAIGRDFYDTVFLWGKTNPNAEYLRQKVNIENNDELWEKLEMRCAAIDFAQLANDLKPFVADSHEAEKVTYFHEFIEMKRRETA